jgi:hypothetical protein
MLSREVQPQKCPLKCVLQCTKAKQWKCRKLLLKKTPKKTPQLENLENIAPKKPAAIPRKRVLAQRKEMDVSVTIAVGSTDIPIDLLLKMEEFIEKECISGLCSIERGRALLRLYLQMVCGILASMMSKLIHTYLGWNKDQNPPARHHILTKAIQNTGLHTYVGMLGYCLKDKGEIHFQCVHRNITPKEIAEGEEEYVKHGTPFVKNKIVLTHKNLLERAATYFAYKLRKQLGSTLPGTLLPMLRSGQYILCASWVLPRS